MVIASAGGAWSVSDKVILARVFCNSESGHWTHVKPYKLTNPHKYIYKYTYTNNSPTHKERERVIETNMSKTGEHSLLESTTDAVARRLTTDAYVHIKYYNVVLYSSRYVLRHLQNSSRKKTYQNTQLK